MCFFLSEMRKNKTVTAGHINNNNNKRGTNSKDGVNENTISLCLDIVWMTRQPFVPFVMLYVRTCVWDKLTQPAKPTHFHGGEHRREERMSSVWWHNLKNQLNSTWPIKAWRLEPPVSQPGRRTDSNYAAHRPTKIQQQQQQTTKVALLPYGKLLGYRIAVYLAKQKHHHLATKCRHGEHTYKTYTCRYGCTFVWMEALSISTAAQHPKRKRWV